MAREFTWRKPNGEWVEPGAMAPLKAALLNRVDPGKYDVTKDGEVVASGFTRTTLLDFVPRRLRAGELGGVFRIRDGADVVFTCRAVIPVADVPADSTVGNVRSDRYFNFIRDHYPKARFAGCYVCKLISGTSTHSQHSYANADDFFFDSLAQQKEAANLVAAHADELEMYHIIDLNRTWTKGVGWHSTPGNDHYHLHGDFDPQYSGDCGPRGV